ncbi:MAG: sigma 54-interacting transcriptional regulator, partial [Candidatus Rokuibacteriota bacterium]
RLSCSGSRADSGPVTMQARPEDGPIGSGERHRVLLEINNAVVSNLDQAGLFRAIARAVRRVVPFERNAMFLHDPEQDVLRLFVLEASLPSSYFTVGLEMSAADSHVGRVFRRREPLLRTDLATEREYAAEEQALADGIRSYAIVPLVARDRAIGALAVASTTPGRYSASDVAFLQEAAGQIALAVENMNAYEQITALNRELADEVARRREAEGMLRATMEGTAAVTGRDFFYSLVRHLAGALGVRYAFVTECGPGGTHVRTRAFWKGDGFGENFEYDVAGTPCRAVVDGRLSYHCARVQGLFPEDPDLGRLGAESYLGMPLVDSSGRVIGHLAVLDDRPMEDPPRGMSVLRVFASRAGAELERLKADEALRAALAEVESLRNRLQAENVYLREEIHREHNFDELVGSSPALVAVLRQVERVAPTDAAVLILGETGTGKELIARAIHSRSLRRERPLVKVNCGAIPAGLVESELFGHVKGAFTGALSRRIGRFELADRGTLFLDEVGELAPETQVKLLRVLQEREFEPVGSSQTVRVDVRVIAATGRDLEEAVRAGRFRSDLYYRLNVFPLKVPPLRERPEDVPQLVTFFLDRFSRTFNRRIEGVAPETLERLRRYPWPGNVRELQNVIDRGVILARGPVLTLESDVLPGLPPGAVAGPPPGPSAGAPSLEEVERRHILAVLGRTDGVIEGPNGAARILALHPNTLRSRMKKLGITRTGHGIS